jgi:NAD(P)-dependent dehydrogenase (short-subunit alcohol dehydrogenase family)
MAPQLFPGALQSNRKVPVRIVNVSSKMHELAGRIPTDDPHFARDGAFSSLAAYNRSKLAQAILCPHLYPPLHTESCMRGIPSQEGGHKKLQRT